MVRQETQECTVSAPASELWDHLADYGNVVRLASPSASAHRIASNPHARYEARLEWEGIESRYRTTLVDAEKPRTLTWRGVSGFGVGSVQFDMTPLEEASTRVRATLIIDAGATSRPLEPFAWGILAPMFRRTMRKLQGLQLEPQDGLLEGEPG